MGAKYDRTVLLRVEEAQLERWKLYAREHGMTFSEWARKVLDAAATHTDEESRPIEASSETVAKDPGANKAPPYRNGSSQIVRPAE